MTEPTQPHDAFFKAAFHSPQAAASQIRALLPFVLVELLELDGIEEVSGEGVSDRLQRSERDLVFRVPLRGEPDLWVLVLHEHQSTEPPLAPYRFLRYALGTWADWLETQEGPPCELRLPGIVALVLHHGPKPWSGPRALHELIALPAPALSALGNHVPNLELVIDDLHVIVRTPRRMRMTARGACWINGPDE